MIVHTQQKCSIKEAYKMIDDFFSCYHLHEALHGLDRLYKWACKEKYYKKTPPADIVCYVRYLHRLFAAAETICDSTSNAAVTIIYRQANDRPVTTDMKVKPSLTTHRQQYPGHLNTLEYVVPYYALQKVKNIPAWEEVLTELTEAALSKGTIEGIYPIGKIVKWKSWMEKILEGAWLVGMKDERIRN